MICLCQEGLRSLSALTSLVIVPGIKHKTHHNSFIKKVSKLIYTIIPKIQTGSLIRQYVLNCPQGQLTHLNQTRALN